MLEKSSNDKQIENMGQLVTWQWPDRKIDLDGRNTKVAGILNITKDSFSDGGRFWEIDQAIQRGRQIAAEGAAIIDLGGQSTRPGYQAITVEAELERVLPVLKALKDEVKIPISVDTDKPEVAQAVLAAGAHIINDESGGNAAMAQAVATYGAPVILMHRPAEKPTYQQVSSDVIASLRETIALYESFGVERQSMMIDPGLGFGKSHEDNIAVLAHLDLLHDLDLPILVGASRKSFIGKVTGEVEPANRLSGSLAVAVWCAVQQIQIVRVHDVAATVQALAMMQAMMKG